MPCLNSILLTGSLAMALTAGAGWSQEFPPALDEPENEIALQLDDDAERNYVSPAARLAYGRFEDRKDLTRHPWPTKVLSIGHNIASYQNYGKRIPQGPYFHGGIDIRSDAGTPIYASAGGKVVNVENYGKGNPAYWEVAILDDEGFLWQYHHVEQRSIPQAIHTAFKDGQKVASGTKLGEVFKWEVSAFGEIFHHIHFNVLGEGKKVLNPLAFLQPLADKAAPEVKAISLLKNGKLVKDTKVSGNYSLAAEVSDLILHTKFIVPPDSITYEIDGADPVLVWRFDHLPGGDNINKYVHDFFVPSATVGNYNQRKMVIDLAFRPGKKDQVFPTTPGTHKITVKVQDCEGNKGEKSFQWIVQ